MAIHHGLSVTPLQVVGYGFTALMTYSCARHVLTGGLKEDVRTFAGRTAKDWLEIVLGGIVCVGLIFAVFMISDHLPSVFHFSWVQLIASKGESKEGANLNLAGATIPYFGIFFLILVILNLPSLARVEEEIFRDGTKDWKDGAVRSLKFGLVHMLVGVPLWAGLILTVPGMWFTRQYFKGGVDRSTMAHAIYNLLLASFLFAAVVGLIR